MPPLEPVSFGRDDGKRGGGERRGGEKKGKEGKKKRGQNTACRNRSGNINGDGGEQRREGRGPRPTFRIPGGGGDKGKRGKRKPIPVRMGRGKEEERGKKVNMSIFSSTWGEKGGKKKKDRDRL